MKNAQDILAEVDRRRRELGMSCRALAERSGTSLRTVQRLLRGRDQGARLSTVLALADALGMQLGFVKKRRASAIEREQARKKARELAAITQGSAALEGQAVPAGTVRRVVHKIESQLLAGPRVRLWG